MDELDDYIKKAKAEISPSLGKIKSAQKRAKELGHDVSDDVVADFFDTVMLESGRSHYNKNGSVKESPRDPKDGQVAVGFSQIKPGTIKKWGNLDPYNENDNIAGGLLEFNSIDKSDPIARRIGYFAGGASGALKKYRATGEIPSGGDFTKTSFREYIERTNGFKAVDDYIRTLKNGGTEQPPVQPQPNQSVPADDIDAYIQQSAQSIRQPNSVDSDGIKRTQPVTEKDATIEQQIQSASDPNVKTRFGVLTTAPEQNAIFGNRSDFLGIPVKEGMLWVNPKKIIANKKLKLKNENDIRQYVEKNPKALTTLIGISEDVGNNTQGTAITAKDPNTGLELATGVVTNPASAIEQARNYKDQFPNADISVTNTDDVVRQREEVDRLAPTSPTGEADDPDEMGRLQKRFESERRADPTLTVERFKNKLKLENEELIAKSKQEWLLKNPAFAKFALDSKLDPFDQKSIEAYNANQRSLKGQRVTKPAGQKAVQQLATKAKTKDEIVQAGAIPQIVPNQNLESGVLKTANGSTIKRVTDDPTYGVAPPDGFERYVDANNQTYLVNELDGTVQDESLAAVADTFQVKKVPINMRNIVPVEEAKKRLAIQVADQIGAKYDLDKNDVYAWILKKGIVDVGTDKDASENNLYQTVQDTRNAATQNNKTSIGSSDVRTDGLDSTYSLTGRQLQSLLSEVPAQTSAKEQAALQRIAQGAISPDPTKAELEGLGVNLDRLKRNPKFYAAAEKGKQAQLNIERIADDLKQSGDFDDYTAPIKARANLGIIGQGVAQAEIDAYKKTLADKTSANRFFLDETPQGVSGVNGRSVAMAGGMIPESQSQRQSRMNAWIQRQLKDDLEKNGSFVKYQENLAKAEAEEQERQKRIANDPVWQKVLKGTQGYLLGVPKSVIKGGASVLQGAPIWTKPIANYIDSLFGTKSGSINENAIFKLGQAIKDAADTALPTDKDYDKSFLAGTVPQALGSSLAFLPAALGGPLGIALFSTLQMTGDSYEDALQGKAKEPDAQQYARLNGGLLGWTELLGFGNAFQRLVKGSAKTTWKKLALEALKEAGEEVFTNEGPQSIGSNVLAKLTYDPNRKWDKDLMDSLQAAGVTAPLASVLISGLLHVKHAKAIKRIAQNDLINGGPSVRDFGDETGFYVFGKSVPETDDLKPLFDKHREIQAKIAEELDAYQKVQKRWADLPKTVTLNGTQVASANRQAKYLGYAQEIQQNILALAKEQSDVSKQIVEQSGVPSPTLLDQKNESEDAQSVITSEDLATEAPKVEPTEAPVETPVEAPVEAPKFKEGERAKVKKASDKSYDTLDFEDEILPQSAPLETKALVQDQPVEVQAEGKTETGKTQFQPVDENNKQYVWNKRYSDTANEKQTGQFIAKDGKPYVLQRTFEGNNSNREIRVYDANGKQVGIAVFDVTPDAIQGYSFNQSIKVEPAYRRKGIATAMIDFAEQQFGKPYKPIDPLATSSEMAALQDKRFGGKTDLGNTNPLAENKEQPSRSQEEIDDQFIAGHKRERQRLMRRQQQANDAYAKNPNAETYRKLEEADKALKAFNATKWVGNETDFITKPQPVESKEKVNAITYKVGDIVTTPNGKVRGTVESVNGNDLGVAWDTAPVEGEVAETTVDKVKPVAGQDIKGDGKDFGNEIDFVTKPQTIESEAVTQSPDLSIANIPDGVMVTRGNKTGTTKRKGKAVIVESNGEQIGIYTPAWKPVDQPMKQAVSSEDDYGQARDDAERVRGGSLEVRRLDSRGEQGRIKGGQRAVEASIVLAGVERAVQEASPANGSGVEHSPDTRRNEGTGETARPGLQETDDGTVGSDRPMKQVTAKESRSFNNAKTIPARQLVQEVDYTKNARIVEEGVIAVDEIREVELIRRLLNEATGTPGGAFYGVFNSKQVTGKFLKTLTQKIKAANEKGVDTKQLKNLKQLVTNAAKNGDGTVIFAMTEKALPEEKSHRALSKYREGQYKQIEQSVADDIANSDVFKKAKNFQKNYAGATQAVQVEEFAVKASLGQWEDLGLKTDADKYEAMRQARNFYRSYEKVNQKEGVDIATALATEIAYAQEYQNYVGQGEEVQSEKETAKGTDAPSNVKSAGGSSNKTDAPKSKGKPDELAGKLKSREPGKSGLKFDEAEAAKAKADGMKVAAISRAFGIEMYRVPVGMEETATTARQLIDDRGMDSILHEALTGQPSAAGKLAVYWELERLNALALAHQSEGNTLEADAVRQRLSDIVASLAVREQEMGREINISKWLPALSPEAAILTAQKMLNKGFGDDSKLNDKQIKKVQELAEELQKSRMQVAKSEAIIAEQQRIIDSLEENAPTKPVLNRQEALLDNYKKREKVIKAELAKRFPNSPAFSGDQAMRMAVGGNTETDAVIDPESASLLKDYTIGQVLTNRSYNAVIDEIRTISGASLTQAKDIHAEAMDEIRGAKEPTSEEAKKRIQIRQEHYKEADKHAHPEKDIAKAIKSVESNLKRQIASLEQEIETGQKAVKAKQAVTSPEIENLKRQRDELKATRDALMGDKLTTQEKIDRAIKTTKESIDKLTKQIKEGDTSVKEREVLSSPELDALRETQKDLRKTLRGMRPSKIALQAAEMFPEDHELIAAIDRLTGNKPKSINEVIRDLMALGHHVTEAKGIAMQAKAEIEKIRAANQRAKDAAKGIQEEERKKLREATTKKASDTRALNAFLGQLAANPNAMKRFNNDFRAKLVSNWGTQIFNAVQSTAITTLAQIGLDLIEAGLRAMGINLGEDSGISVKHAFLAYQYIFANQRQLAMDALAQFPEQYFIVHSGLLGDIPIEPLQLAHTKKGAMKVVHGWFDLNEKLNEKLTHITGAKKQEMYFRNAIVASTMDAIIRKKSDGKMNLKKAVEQGKLREYITEADATRAAKRALEVTQAVVIDDPVGIQLKKWYDTLDNIVPILLNPVVYARFTYTATKVMVLNPLTFGLTDQALFGAGKLFRLEGADNRPQYSTRDIAKGIFAWGTVATAYGLMKAIGGDDDKWYTLYPFGKDGPVWDIRRTFPLSAFFYTAHVIGEVAEGKPLPSATDMLEGFASLETDYFQYGAPMELMGAGKEWLTTLGKKGEVKDAAVRSLGNYLAGLTRFFKPMRDAIAQFDAEERAYKEDPETAGDKFLNELSRSLPFATRFSGQAKKYDMNGKPIEQPFPLGRIFGVNIANPTFSKNKDSVATAWANELFPFTSSKKMSPEDRDRLNARNAIKEAKRAGKDVDVEKALGNMKITLNDAAKNRLYDELEYSELGAKIKYSFGGDKPDDVKALQIVWQYATPDEKAEIKSILDAKEMPEEVRESFQLPDKPKK